MLDDKGNTAVYLQYAYMRIRLVGLFIFYITGFNQLVAQVDDVFQLIFYFSFVLIAKF